jgi:hypothetical protein
MRVIIGGYNIDINVDNALKAKKSTWVKDRVKSFLWTGIDKGILESKFSEVYDLILGR